MYTRIDISGKEAIVSLPCDNGFGKEDIARSLSNGEAFEMKDDQKLDNSKFVHLDDIANRLQEMMKDVSARFVDRDELVEVFTLGLVAGEHTFVLSPPGTAKTAVATALTKAVKGKLWRTLMNPDLTRDGLVGMIDPFAFQAGKWQRQWSGIATCDVAIVDEIWKGSGQNNNILLDVLEERRVREGETDQAIPLLSVLSMSNEIPEDSERQAIYDRFLIRLTVGYMKDVSQFQNMLVASVGSQAQKQYVEIDELRLMAACAELLALDPPKNLMDTITELWREVGQNGHGVSDRRWRKTLKLACAYALMNGRQPSGIDATVAKWTLWQDPDEEANIRKLVLSKCDPLANDILNLEALFADLSQRIDTLDRTDFQEMAEVSGNLGKFIDQVEVVMDEATNSHHSPKLQELKSQGEEFMSVIIRGK